MIKLEEQIYLSYIYRVFLHHYPPYCSISRTKSIELIDTTPAPPAEATGPKLQLYPIEHPEYATQALERLERGKELKEKFPNRFHVMPETPFVLRVHTVIRDRDTPRGEFLFHSEQLFRALMEYSLEQAAYEPKTIYTPTDNAFHGLQLSKEVVGVSIMRSGECLEHALQDSIRGVKIGKILVQRDESTSEKSAKLFYSKLPDNINKCFVLLLDPMLASGSSARLCIRVLLDQGVKQEDIVFVNLIAAPHGVQTLLEEFPQLTIVTTMLDRELNDHKYILPGVGDYGDLYFGT